MIKTQLNLVSAFVKADELISLTQKNRTKEWFIQMLL